MNPPAHTGGRTALRLTLGLGVLAVAAAGLAWLATELIMAPRGSERLQLVALFVALAVASVVVGLALYQVTHRVLSRRIVLVVLAGPAIVGVATVVGAQSMFVDAHDTQFVFILLALGTSLAAAVVTMLTRPLVRDLDHLRRVAEQLGSGELGARAELQRSDEVGELAMAIDAMAEQIADANRRRDDAERERSVMLTSLSHDARTPLTAMRVAVEAMQDGLAPDPARYLDSIDHDLKSVEQLIDNIFVLGRLEAGRLEPRIEAIDVAAIATACVVSLQPLADEKDVLIAMSGDEALMATGDPAEVYRVIQNLIVNAVRHSPASGTVVVDLSTDPEPGVTVFDEGSGFEEAFIAQAFDPFTRAEPARERSHGGAGLGLAVARGIVETLGGSIWAAPGPGGIVGFTLQPARR